MVKGILLLKGMLTIVSYLKKMCTPNFMAVMKLMKLKMPSVKLNHKPSLDRFLANPSSLISILFLTTLFPQTDPLSRLHVQSLLKSW